MYKCPVANVPYRKKKKKKDKAIPNPLVKPSFESNLFKFTDTILILNYQ